MSWNKFLILVAVVAAVVNIWRMNQPRANTLPPYLEVLSPLPNAVVTSTSVHVSGNANVPYVMIRGVKVPTVRSTFNYDFPRSAGARIVDVTAKNNIGTIQREVMVNWIQ